MAVFDIRSCLLRLEPWVIRTPLVVSDYLSAICGRRVFLKLESLQRTRAFKFRGAMNYLLTMDQGATARGVITASSGNHGLGLALGSRLLGLKCVVVMPKNAALVKQEKAKGYGADLVLHGMCYDEAQEHAAQLALNEGYVYVSSFDHERIMEGQATILAEILAEFQDMHYVFAPIGGGGMVSGMLLAREQLSVPIEIVGVEPLGAACMKASVDVGSRTTLPSLETIADGVAVRTPGKLNFEVVQKYNPPLCQVSDEEILRTQKELLLEQGLVVETAGAVAVAGMRNFHFPAAVKNIVCVVTGANVNRTQLVELLN